MTTNDNKRTPLDRVISKDYIKNLKTGSKTLKTLISDIEEKYKLLFNNKYDESLFLKEENVYFIDQSILIEFDAKALSKEQTTLDVVLELYLSWAQRIQIQLINNARHYNKNKIIKSKLDDLILSIIPNAKVVSSKVDIFIAKADEYFISLEKSNSSTEP